MTSRQDTDRLTSRKHARWLAIARSAGVAIITLAALALSLRWLGQHQAVGGWLVWTLFIIWGWQLLLAVSMFGAGHAVVWRLLGIRPCSLVELLALAMPAGALVFVLGLFVAGYLGCLSPELALLWPSGLTLLALLSAGDGFASLSAWLARRRPGVVRMTSFRVLATGLGVLAVAIMYFQSLAPSALTFDAAWTHLTIAQDYAREGRIVPFLADWPKNLPHLGSMLGTWSFLVPGLAAPGAKVMMALHTELAFFLWTLVSVAAAMARIGGYRPGAWAAMFLFPGMLLSEHGLGGGADHFLAFWAAPVFLAVLGTVETRAPRWWIMLAVALSGAVLTRLQAAFLVVPAALMLAFVLARDSLRRLRGQPWPGGRAYWLGPAAAVAMALVLTAPHFLKNLVHHGNPLYPFAQDIFLGSTPTVPDAALLANNVLRSWMMHPPTTLAGQLRGLAHAVVNFPCHPQAPASGMLFAVALVVAPLLPRARRLVLGLVFACLALVTWLLSYPQARNLEGLLPIVALVTGACIVRALRLGRVARIGLGVLLVMQIVAGFATFFASSRRIADAMGLARSSRHEGVARRLTGHRREYVELGRSLPKHAVVLLHTMYGNLGIDRPVLHDGLGFQGLIDPRAFRTARDLYLRLDELGVTHVVYEPGRHAAGTRQGEAVFAVFASHCREKTRQLGSLRVFPLPSEPPPPAADYQVLLSGIREQADGLYAIAELGTVEKLPERLRTRRPPRLAIAERPVLELLAQARVALLGHEAKLDPPAQRLLAAQFERFVSYPEFSVYVARAERLVGTGGTAGTAE